MLWVKAFHIVSMVCWFAALFYLPRLFVYHVDATDALSRDRFSIMERRLYRGIATPSMIATIVFGGWLISYNADYYLSAGWLHAKLTVVVLLIGYHHICGRYVKKFAAGTVQKSGRFFRVFNELPVLALLAIVILAVVRPF
ncbi:protoporphyrinogen oxidase HemJ [Microbulbifer harenosus]|uniref:Protoporphyrinogen IX oxidase n=1 Tax=Microbulbifer harenosus TaxID=2576840 RepID=A0ABY2UN07_9GAMM|nr:MULTISPECIES: protoporphyrinogen oxidase HemJ [Microbulbifer]QIL90271.1 protoporphyrinogen oxidase HemJ [Microbulbifer sp. SH-1]TLM78101.1 protoporphyrinogen oxidase HemJ [Microbulbifer harenosus]